MNKAKTPRNSSLLMLELIIAILFFALASAVCVQMFVKAHDISRDANALSFAVRECSSVAETISGCDTSKAAYNLAGDIYFDERFSECDKSKAMYVVKTSVKDADKGMIEAEIAAFAYSAPKGEIYSLDITHNVRGEVK